MESPEAGGRLRRHEHRRNWCGRAHWNWAPRRFEQAVYPCDSGPLCSVQLASSVRTTSTAHVAAATQSSSGIEGFVPTVAPPCFEVRLHCIRYCRSVFLLRGNWFPPPCGGETGEKTLPAIPLRLHAALTNTHDVGKLAPSQRIYTPVPFYEQGEPWSNPCTCFVQTG